MSVKMKFGSKDIPFVYKGDKLVYPNPIKDGLLLWYDFKGMRNTDTNKEVAKDLSGNGNDGTLTNFNFTEESGYKDNTLVFDGVDDSLTIPELVLDETAMTVMQDGKLYAYEDDKVMTVGEDGEIVGSGKNVLLSPQENLTVGDYHFNHSKSFITDDSRESGYRIKYSNYERTGVSSSLYLYSSSGDTFTRDITGETISVSFWMRGSTPFMFGSKMIGTEWTLWTWTGTKAVSNNHYYINRDETLNWFEISDVKVEIGDSVTSYSPSPSDYKTTTLSPASLTDLQLYNKTLNKTELLHNVESKGLKQLKPGVVVQDGLLLHYDFSHESNNSEHKGKTFDYSGNGNHGALQNFGYAEGSGYDEGLTFDGVDDYVETQNSEDFDITGNLSIEGVFYIPEDDEISIGGLLVKGNYGSWATNAYGMRSVVAAGNITQYRFFATDSNGEQSRVNISFEAGKVNYAVGVVDFDEGLITSYLNGKKLFSNPLIINHIKKTSDSIYVGEAYGHNSLMKGNIYSARIYNKALTPEEIQHNYQIEKEKFNIIEGEM